ncbi:MAG: metallopeptidase family protein [Actinomycetaceae bacterium]|nr:metallopeptidase family protein [Actinomycetaceae bacterium]
MRPTVRRRDRHGRGSRSPLFPPGLPARSNWRESFDQIVALQVAEIMGRLPQLSRIEVGIDEVPASDPASWEPHSVVLCRTFPENRLARLAPRLVLYRLPIQARAGRISVREMGSPLHVLVRLLLVENLAALSGLSMDEVNGGPVEII